MSVLRTRDGRLVERSNPLAVRAHAYNTLTTVLNAVSVPSGGREDVFFPGEGADEIWVSVRIDQAPWTLSARAGSRGGIGSLGDTYFFPQRTQVAETFPAAHQGATSLLMSGRIGSTVALDTPTSFAEARQYLWGYPLGEDMQVRIQNDGAGIATVTMSIIKVWR